MSRRKRGHLLRKSNAGIWILAILFGILLALSTKLGEDRTMKYEFQVVKDEEIINNFYSSRICGVYDYGMYSGEMGNQEILAFGQLKTLFGEPLYITENLENQYEYCLMATGPEGEQILLSAYGGAGGAAIGGDAQDWRARDAAEELAARIRGARASDYDYVGYYLDAPAKVWQGVKNGVPYHRAEMLDHLSEEEFTELCNRLYGLE